MKLLGAVLIVLCLSGNFGIAVAGEVHRQVFFGDTHVHTSFSFDSYFLGNQSAGPDTAYRYAKGLPVVHPGHRARVRIGTPLDFLVVADHAEGMGVPFMLSQQASEYLESNEGRALLDKFSTAEGRQEIYRAFARSIRLKGAEKPGIGLHNPVIARSIWEESIAITESHNSPGRFTTFHGWEWSPTPGGSTLHRVIFMPNGADIANQFVPFSAYESQRPEDLWNWLEDISQVTGAEFLAIPHNSNLSGGLAFATKTSDGSPFNAEYARERINWESIVEITQAKGDSETYPLFSPNDEFADFERFDNGLTKVLPSGEIVPQIIWSSSYIRPSFLEGLGVESRIGVNPFKFGIIGSTDQHTGIPSSEEDNFHGKFTRDSTPESGQETYGIWKNRGWDFSAGGLAAVWAEENTRASIFAAFKRKEVYGTTGSRLRVQFFGGWRFSEKDIKDGNLADAGYAKGVPMGGDLPTAPDGKSPTFLVAAVKDPDGANLDRIQIIKGWLDDDGESHEQVFDVALSDGRTPDAKGIVAQVGNTVDVKTASYSNSIGDPVLMAAWKDERFQSEHPALYYVRVLEIPTPRHSLFDAVALGIAHPDEYPASIQERAYTSPIWYTP